MMMDRLGKIKEKMNMMKDENPEMYSKMKEHVDMMEKKMGGKSEEGMAVSVTVEEVDENKEQNNEGMMSKLSNMFDMIEGEEQAKLVQLFEIQGDLSSRGMKLKLMLDKMSKMDVKKILESEGDRVMGEKKEEIEESINYPDNISTDYSY